MNVDCDFSSQRTKVCKIKDGWCDAGKTGQYFGSITIHGRCWAVVLWDDDDEPDLYKLISLKILRNPKRKKEKPSRTSPKGMKSSNDITACNCDDKCEMIVPAVPMQNCINYIARSGEIKNMRCFNCGRYWWHLHGKCLRCECERIENAKKNKRKSERLIKSLSKV